MLGDGEPELEQNKDGKLKSPDEYNAMWEAGDMA